MSDEQTFLVYGEFKKLRGAVHLDRSNDQVRFKIGLKEKTGDISVDGLIDRNGAIKILQRESTFLTCPVCLAAGTRIQTPDGSVLVQNVKPGDRVWTVDATGHKISVPVLKTSAVPVSSQHRVVHLILSDGRELCASPSHPTADGHTVGELEVNGAFNGALVKSAELISYQEYKTYDLLPAGDTAFYWANGILLASTLR